MIRKIGFGLELFQENYVKNDKSLLSKSLAHGVGPKIPHNELSHNGNELEEYNDAHILLYVNTMKKMLLLLKHNIHLLFGQVLILSW